MWRGGKIHWSERKKIKKGKELRGKIRKKGALDPAKMLVEKKVADPFL